MSVEPKVHEVYDELLRLAHEAVDWDTVTWLDAVGECFDGGDFEIDNFSVLRWRLSVLRDKGLLVERLIDACQAVLDTERTRNRNECLICGNLRMNVRPVRLKRLSLEEIK